MNSRWCLLLFIAAGCGVAPPTPPAQTVAAPPPATQAAPAQAAPQPLRPSAPPPEAPAPLRPSAPPPKTAAAAPPKASPPAAPPKAAAAPALDLKTLEERLRATNAIGVMTKLSLKNQVDDLITRFRQYHAGHRPPGLADLRPAFELLLMKVLSLLQDSDRALAHDINASRDALWAVLADRDKLAQYQ